MNELQQAIREATAAAWAAGAAQVRTDRIKPSVKVQMAYTEARTKAAEAKARALLLAEACHVVPF